MPESEGWYELVVQSPELLQGDLLFDCNVAIPLEYPNEGNVPAQIKTFDVVLMSQSCDLVNNKTVIALVCPFFELAEFKKSHANLFNAPCTEMLLARDAQPGFHVLNRVLEPGMEHDFLVVDFHNAFSVPTGQLRDQARAMTTPRLRLCSLYREDLAQAFARYFMRVALPTRLYKPLGSAVPPPPAGQTKPSQ
jgi:hypothetical protein